MASRAIHEACRHKDLDRIATLLRSSRDPIDLINAPDDLGRTPLMLASLRGHFDVALCCLDKGSRIDQVGK